MRRRRDIRDPDPDDTSPQADLLRAVRTVEKGRASLIWAALLAGMFLAWYFEDTLPPAQMAMGAFVIAVLLAIHGELCALRIDAYRRELRGRG